MKLYKGALVAVFVATLALAACNTDEPELPLTESYETILGEVKSLGGISVEEGITHLFEDETGTIFYTFSDRYDLYSGDYYSTEIEAYGVLREFASIDKNVFEIQRITEVEQEEQEEVLIEDVVYKDTDYGFSFTYTTDWELEALRDSVVLTAPLVDLDEDDPEYGETLPNYMVVAKTSAVIVPETSEPEVDEEAETEESELVTVDLETQITEFVSANYGFLDGSTEKVSYIGPDKMMAISYETDNSDIVYFVPRQEELFEVAFYHPSEYDEGLLEQKNVFSKIIASFKFVAYNGVTSTNEELETEDDDEEPEAPEVEIPVEEVEETVEEPELETPLLGSKPEQVDISNLGSFTSKPYGFSISYPAAWYYRGGNGGYDFATESLEDDSAAGLIRLNVNSGQESGGSISGDTASYTSVVDGRAYTLTGPAEYYDLMQSMASSVQVVEEL